VNVGRFLMYLLAKRMTVLSGIKKKWLAKKLTWDFEWQALGLT